MKNISIPESKWCSRNEQVNNAEPPARLRGPGFAITLNRYLPANHPARKHAPGLAFCAGLLSRIGDLPNRNQH